MLLPCTLAKYSFNEGTLTVTEMVPSDLLATINMTQMDKVSLNF